MSSINSGGRKNKRKRRPPGILQFTPTKDMPDTLYYQVSLHHGMIRARPINFLEKYNNLMYSDKIITVSELYRQAFRGCHSFDRQMRRY